LSGREFIDVCVCVVAKAVELRSTGQPRAAVPA
jgi:hypothetical protein